MTNYTNHPDALFDEGKPILGRVALEKRDNLIAVTEGSDGGDGAPKIRGAAIATPSDLPVLTVTASDTVELSNYNNTITAGTSSTSSTSYVVAHTVVIVAVTGTVRFSATLSPSGGDGQFRVLKNGSQVDSWLVTDGDSDKHSEDIAVIPTDVITWQHRSLSSLGTSIMSSVIETASDGYQPISPLKPYSEF